ncbi:MAG TPA: hypothetical protein VLM89_01065 [Phycisphaerae bacterium]|nr:hypothetical protein [Phycisphaerae bacterium]
MFKGRWHRRPVRWLVAAVATAAMGADCLPAIPFPGGQSSTHPKTVVIEMLNYTDYQIEPRLFVDPAPGIMVYDQLIRDENWVLVDPPLQPDEIATYEFACADVGTMAADYAQMYISDNEYIESDNGPWLIRGQDFECGDDISLVFIDDGEVFFTRVEVNGQFLTD